MFVEYSKNTCPKYFIHSKANIIKVGSSIEVWAWGECGCEVCCVSICLSYFDLKQNLKK